MYGCRQCDYDSCDGCYPQIPTPKSLPPADDNDTKSDKLEDKQSGENGESGEEKEETVLCYRQVYHGSGCKYIVQPGGVVTYPVPLGMTLHFRAKTIYNPNPDNPDNPDIKPGLLGLLGPASL